MKIFLIRKNTADSNALNLSKMADLFGLKLLDHPVDSSDFAIIVSQENLDAVSKLPPARAVLVYDCCQNSEKFKVVRAHGGLYRMGGVKYITQQFSGLSIPSANATYALSGLENADTLIWLNDDPFFVVQKKEGCEWFFLAQKDAVDLDSPIHNKNFSFNKMFAQIIPFAMFFKYISKSRFNQYANLMIDDPSLLHRYGFIDYGQLVDVTRDNDFAVTIAFIPWNYKKSHRKTVDLFSANHNRLSICVHGCDHAASEFASMDDIMLNWKISLARKRMEHHKRRFGLSYDNAIVFPHGAFSVESMRVLRQHRFTAAVNSTIFARNYYGGLKVRDFITPSTTYYGLPLFLRRSPKHIEDFAYDLFFGRPALIVQHSVDFAEGWDRVIAFVNQLKSMEPRLKWRPLGKIVEKMCPADQQIQAEIRGDGLTPHVDRRYSLKSWFEAALRRTMCEMRDRIVHRSKFLRGDRANWLGHT